MKKKQWILVIAMVIGIVGPTAGQASDEWVSVTDPGELSDLIIGKTIKHGNYVDFIRQDGAMGSLNIVFNTVVTRTWVIRDDGRFCYYVYQKPDRLVDCVKFSQSSADPNFVKVTILRNEGSFSESGTLSDNPPSPEVSDAIDEVAGPMD